MSSVQRHQFVPLEGTLLLRKLSASARSGLRHYEVGALLQRFQPLLPLTGAPLQALQYYYFVVTDWSLFVLSRDSKVEGSVLLEIPWLAVRQVLFEPRDSDEDLLPSAGRPVIKSMAITLYPVLSNTPTATTKALAKKPAAAAAPATAGSAATAGTAAAAAAAGHSTGGLPGGAAAASPPPAAPAAWYKRMFGGALPPPAAAAGGAAATRQAVAEGRRPAGPVAEAMDSSLSLGHSRPYSGSPNATASGGVMNAGGGGASGRAGGGGDSLGSTFVSSTPRPLLSSLGGTARVASPRGGAGSLSGTQTSRPKQSLMASLRHYNIGGFGDGGQQQQQEGPLQQQEAVPRPGLAAAAAAAAAQARGGDSLGGTVRSNRSGTLNTSSRVPQQRQYMGGSTGGPAPQQQQQAAGRLGEPQNFMTNAPWDREIQQGGRPANPASSGAPPTGQQYPQQQQQQQYQQPQPVGPAPYATYTALAQPPAGMPPGGLYPQQPAAAPLGGAQAPQIGDSLLPPPPQFWRPPSRSGTTVSGAGSAAAAAAAAALPPSFVHALPAGLLPQGSPRPAHGQTPVYGTYGSQFSPVPVPRGSYWAFDPLLVPPVPQPFDEHDGQDELDDQVDDDAEASALLDKYRLVFLTVEDHSTLFFHIQNAWLGAHMKLALVDAAQPGTPISYVPPSVHYLLPNSCGAVVLRGQGTGAVDWRDEAASAPPSTSSSSGPWSYPGESPLWGPAVPWGGAYGGGGPTLVLAWPQQRQRAADERRRVLWEEDPHLDMRIEAHWPEGMSPQSSQPGADRRAVPRLQLPASPGGGRSTADELRHYNVQAARAPTFQGVVHKVDKMLAKPILRVFRRGDVEVRCEVSPAMVQELEGLQESRRRRLDSAASAVPEHSKTYALQIAALQEERRVAEARLAQTSILRTLPTTTSLFNGASVGNGGAGSRGDEVPRNEAREVFRELQENLVGCSLFDDDDLCAVKLASLEGAFAGDQAKLRALSRLFFSSPAVLRFLLSRLYAWGTICAVYGPEPAPPPPPPPRPAMARAAPPVLVDREVEEEEEESSYYHSSRTENASTSSRSRGSTGSRGRGGDGGGSGTASGTSSPKGGDTREGRRQEGRRGSDGARIWGDASSSSGRSDSVGDNKGGKGGRRRVVVVAPELPPSPHSSHRPFTDSIRWDKVRAAGREKDTQGGSGGVSPKKGGRGGGDGGVSRSWDSERSTVQGAGEQAVWSPSPKSPGRALRERIKDPTTATSDEKAYEFFLQLYHNRSWQRLGLPPKLQNLLAQLGLAKNAPCSIQHTVDTMMSVADHLARTADAQHTMRGPPPSVCAPPTLAPSDALMLSPLAELPYLFVIQAPSEAAWIMGGLATASAVTVGGTGGGTGGGTANLWQGGQQLFGSGGGGVAVAGTGEAKPKFSFHLPPSAAAERELGRAMRLAGGRNPGRTLAHAYIDEYSNYTEGGGGMFDQSQAQARWGRLAGRLCARLAWKKIKATLYWLNQSLAFTEGCEERLGWMSDKVVELDTGLDDDSNWTFLRCTRHLTALALQLRDPEEGGALWQPEIVPQTKDDILYWARPAAGQLVLDWSVNLLFEMMHLGEQAHDLGLYRVENMVLDVVGRLPRPLVRDFTRSLFLRLVCFMAGAAAVVREVGGGGGARPGSQAHLLLSDVSAFKYNTMLLSMLEEIPTLTDHLYDSYFVEIFNLFRTPQMKAKILKRSGSQVLASSNLSMFQQVLDLIKAAHPGQRAKVGANLSVAEAMNRAVWRGMPGWTT